ncbi:hypothetical protein FQA39_LY03079 [Lamprigera yunnana]|nr:hypothetical protein FQA39_LY03079 [Lamprigera yunnana]
MVVVVSWMQSWTIVIMSLCVLSVASVLLLYCICCDNGKSGQFYALDEKGNKSALTTKIIGKVLPESEKKKTMYSITNETFSLNSIAVHTGNVNEEDDALSCISSDSKHTFYSVSTYNHAGKMWPSVL